MVDNLNVKFVWNVIRWQKKKYHFYKVLYSHKQMSDIYVIEFFFMK